MTPFVEKMLENEVSQQGLDHQRQLKMIQDAVKGGRRYRETSAALTWMRTASQSVLKRSILAATSCAQARSQQACNLAEKFLRLAPNGDLRTALAEGSWLLSQLLSRGIPGTAPPTTFIEELVEAEEEGQEYGVTLTKTASSSGYTVSVYRLARKKERAKLRVQRRFQHDRVLSKLRSARKKLMLQGSRALLARSKVPAPRSLASTQEEN